MIYFTIQYIGCTCVFSYTLGCMRLLEYMGFVLAVFPLKYGFIIVQIYMDICMGSSCFPNVLIIKILQLAAIIIILKQVTMHVENSNKIISLHQHISCKPSPFTLS